MQSLRSYVFKHTEDMLSGKKIYPKHKFKT